MYGIYLRYSQLGNIPEISLTNDFYEISVPVTLLVPCPVTLLVPYGVYLPYPATSQWQPASEPNVRTATRAGPSGSSGFLPPTMSYVT